MIKRLVIFILIVAGLFYVVSGIYFYRKSFRKKYTADKSDTDTIFKFNASDLVVMKESMIDFEDGANTKKYPTSSDFSYSGKNSIKLSPETEYGAEVSQSFSEIPSLSNLRRVEVTVKILNTKITEGTLWVLEINSEDGKILAWHPEDLPTSLNKWDSYTFHFDINPAFLKNFNRIKTYAWNRSKNTCYVDDVTIHFLGIPQEDSSSVLNTLHRTTFVFDLENDSSLEKIENLSEEVSHSGKRSSFINGKNEYSVFINKVLGDVMNDTIKTIYASVWLYPLSDDPECTLVIEVRNSDNEQIHWNGKSTAKMNLKTGSWQKLNAIFNIPPEEYRKFSKSDRIYTYVLNNTRSKLYADDFEISYGNIPELPGNQVYVDMNSLDDRAYQFNRNHPPYPVSYLLQKEINNGGSDFLVIDDSLEYGNFLPDQYFSSGNFSGAGSFNEEVLVVTNNSVEIYQYCGNKKRFVVSGIIPLNKNEFSNALINSGDFNGDGKKELLVTRGPVSKLYAFETQTHKACYDNLNGIKMKMTWSGILNSGTAKILSGKFSGSKNDELFVSDSSGHCTLSKFDGKNWNILANDTLPKLIFGKNSTQVCGKFFTSKNESIFSIYREYNFNRSALIIFMNGEIKLKPIPGKEMTDKFFSADDILFRIPSKDHNNDDILSFNHKWRFEMKRISIDNLGFYISSVVEFKGYANDQNPKYYEFPEFIPGKFTGTETSILCVLKNCADINFDGYHCNKYDSVAGLPNTVQLYNFSK